jgi:hypothetical protein
MSEEKKPEAGQDIENVEIEPLSDESLNSVAGGVACALDAGSDGCPSDECPSDECPSDECPSDGLAS